MDDATRRLTLRVLCSINVVQCVTGAVLLILGIVARSNHGPYTPGVPPYYIGAFICMATVLLQGIIGFVIFYRGKSCVSKNDVAKNIGCWMQTYSLITPINGIGQIAAMLIVGFTGVCKSGHCSYLENVTGNRNLAISTLVFSAIATISSAIGLITVVIYSSNFGFKMFSRGQYQISSLDDRNVTNIEQTPVVDITSGPTQTTVNSIHSNNHSNHAHAHEHSHPDPRLAFPAADFSAHHVSHYLTQQYRERIRKRKKKAKKAKKENHSNNGNRNGRQQRSAPYELPPLSTLSQRFPEPPISPRLQPPDSPSPPLAPTHYPPPSPPSTPPLVSPSSIPIPEIRTTAPSPPPWSLTPSLPPPPPSPPMDYLGVVHVIPCGEYIDDDTSLYSCF